MADLPQDTERRSPAYATPLDLGDIIQAILRQFWVVVLTVVLLTGATIGFSIAQTPQYEASTLIIIGQGGKLTQNPLELAGIRDITDTMVVAISTRTVAEGVIDKLDLKKTPKELLDNMEVKREGPTQFIRVTYTDDDPKRAQLVANTIGNVFSDKVAGVSPSAEAITATIWDPAAVPQTPADPDPVRNGFLALILGLVLGVALALLMDYLTVGGKGRKPFRGSRPTY